MTLTVRIFGLDVDGKPFFQLATAHTLTVDSVVLKGMEHRLRTGDIVGVQYQESKARARVIWAW